MSFGTTLILMIWLFSYVLVLTQTIKLLKLDDKLVKFVGITGTVFAILGIIRTLLIMVVLTFGGVNITWS